MSNEPTFVHYLVVVLVVLAAAAALWLGHYVFNPPPPTAQQLLDELKAVERKVWKDGPRRTLNNLNRRSPSPAGSRRRTTADIRDMREKTIRTIRMLENQV
jgi:hypothetical protein